MSLQTSQLTCTIPMCGILSVEPATFTNNPLSLSLLSDTPLWAILAVRLNHFDPIAIGSFYDALTNPEYSHSYSPRKAPFSLGIKDKMPDGTAFEWLQKNVSIPYTLIPFVS